MSESEQPERDLIILGQAIRHVREQHDVAATELAGASGVERQLIDALEAGRLDPTYELLLALARGLGIRPSVFIVCAEDLKARGARDGVFEDRPPDPR